MRSKLDAVASAMWQAHQFSVNRTQTTKKFSNLSLEEQDDWKTIASAGLMQLFELPPVLTSPAVCYLEDVNGVSVDHDSIEAVFRQTVRTVIDEYDT